jgi:prepilin-type N-terminal cleavage/methylation domain-containing protein
MGKAQRQAAGFTLVELLVALALVGTIMLMVYGSYAAAAGALDRYSRRMACYDRTSLVLRLLARQLRCVYLTPCGTDPTPSPSQSTAATPPSTLAAASFEVGDGSLRFLTTAGPDRTTALLRVAYQLDPSSGILSVCSAPYVSGAGNLQDTLSGRPILTGVTRMDVQLYDGRRWQADAATTAASRTLPQGVKIALTVVDESLHEHQFEMMVPLGCRTAPPVPQTGTTATTPTARI